MKKLVLFLSFLTLGCKKDEILIPSTFDSKICISRVLGPNQVFLDGMTVYYYVSQNTDVSYFIVEKSNSVWFKSPSFTKHDSIPTNKKIGETNYETSFSDTSSNTLKISMYSKNSSMITSKIYDLTKLKLITP